MSNDDKIADFIRDSAGKIIDDLKKSLFGDARPKLPRARKPKPKKAVVVEVMICGLQSCPSKQNLLAMLEEISEYEQIYDLAEFEVLETKVVGEWLVILHFTFLSPLSRDAAKFETEVVLNRELDSESLIAYKVEVHEM